MNININTSLEIKSRFLKFSIVRKAHENMMYLFKSCEHSANIFQVLGIIGMLDILQKI
jgi:hypothetical protein